MSKTVSSVGSNDPMQPPYPADTRAKGWRFDIDYERLEQSSTWALAGPEVKPWLLILWVTAWKQVPCSSLPAEDEVIAAMIGMPLKTWSKHAKVLLRGWSKAADGRLYHHVLTGKVLEMLAKRRSESERKAAYRHGTPQMSRGTGGGQTADSTRKATPTPTPTEKTKTPRMRAGDEPNGFAEFFAAYPRRVARADAAEAFDKQGLTPADVPKLLAAIAAQRGQPDWLKDGGKYIPHPSTWLNGRRWTDETTPAAQFNATAAVLVDNEDGTLTRYIPNRLAV